MTRYGILPTTLPEKWVMPWQKMAMLRGAQVTLVSGSVAIEPPEFVQTVPVVTAEEMFQEVTSRAGEQDIIIKAAAVADYRPKKSAGKR